MFFGSAVCVCVWCYWSRLTQYRTSVQPSIVMHWNTVSMANAKLSKFVIPSLGPSHPIMHCVTLGGEQCRPWAELGAHGAGFSSDREPKWNQPFNLHSLQINTTTMENPSMQIKSQPLCPSLKKKQVLCILPMKSSRPMMA